MHPVSLSAVVEEAEEERGNDCSSEALPTSPTWRRSPSYEQLQQIELDPQRLMHSSSRVAEPSPPHLVGGADRRALTLSVSGSEAESIYGMLSSVMVEVGVYLVPVQEQMSGSLQHSSTKYQTLQIRSVTLLP